MDNFRVCHMEDVNQKEKTNIDINTHVESTEMVVLSLLAGQEADAD